ncbi:MAG: VWA domain-containing protein [Ferrovibrio sp.]|uniref:vWA domain-containing protein n=1 Tax=Ferrovibrio sp. TaxID=1917215 RepID=UPI00262AD693|nr:vWA domain-containing protein [Ferrovibrio sp.]MCW0232860.1 VWA domain-containing protein [Ferrovibrio sp.]
MPAKARREISGGLISFLDVMCCGFGAVVLLVVILNGQVVQKRQAGSETLREELRQTTALEEFAREELAKVMQEVTQVEQKRTELSAQAAEMEARVRDTARKAREAQAQAQAVQSALANLRTQSEAVEKTVSLLRTKADQQWEGGKRPVGFSGDGQRQYLTGLKLGGERTLILVDASASMLDETVVNVVRWKVMDPEVRRNSPKWQRVVRSLHWLLANLRPGKQYQVYFFNTAANPLVQGSDKQWLNTHDTAGISSALLAARTIAPEGGTSLHQAFGVISRMEPKPDSVILLTDGLPTQGAGAGDGRPVSADERLSHFKDSLRRIPNGIPVNTLLFPMEGDPEAAGAFWELAVTSRGSFMTPARDWP